MKKRQWRERKNKIYNNSYKIIRMHGIRDTPKIEKGNKNYMQPLKGQRCIPNVVLKNGGCS